jgi:hypothetical protein
MFVSDSDGKKLRTQANPVPQRSSGHFKVRVRVTKLKFKNAIILPFTYRLEATAGQKIGSEIGLIEWKNEDILKSE